MKSTSPPPNPPPEPPERIKLPPGIPEDSGQLDRILKKDGDLARRWKGFQPRGAQLRMFQETLRAFRQSDTAVIEAGTGTGKTLAYLLPAVISRKKTVISTGLRNLQDQISGKDLQFIREHFDIDFTSAVLKGRDNYVCLRRFASVMRKEKRAGSDPELETVFRTLAEWRQKTGTGEISEIPAKILKKPPFSLLASSRATCLGKSCALNSQCFIQLARAKAASADLILVNHHLLMSDLALKDSGEAKGSLLPEWDAAILDEAHLLEQVAINSFSQRLSLKELQDVCFELSKLLDTLLVAEARAGAGAASQRVRAILDLKASADTQQEVAVRMSLLFQKAPGAEDQSYGELIWPPEKPERRGLKGTLAKLRKDLEELESGSADAFPKDDEEFKPVSMRLKAASETAGFLSGASHPNYVYTVSVSDGSVELAALPIDVSGYLRDKLFNFTKTVVLTSATMASRKSLSYFNGRLGIDPGVKGLVLDSPFDFWSRTVMYVPKSMPAFDRQNKNELFREALVDEMKKLLKVTRGRALILFTSYSQLNAVHERFSRMRLPFRLLKQGEGGESRTSLLDAFREEESSVLMATSSFWQGVDVPGQSLSAVIIDKLPFPVPSDPVYQARADILKKQHRDGFSELSLPEMEIKLKQGLGRLIRSATDWGLLAILDSRITQKYGPSVLQSLSHGPSTNDVETVRKFFEKMEPRRRTSPAGAGPMPGDGGRRG
ncbi:MAG: ATP-dependent DNA helicase [Deltaproteobacteria bacterium]|jgi:ATP-dependent DNA helicase DinG|nr:ATP-dependent DNA helicase [Deltaproteobacteria bacterium]